MAIENKKLENPLYWADPNTWGGIRVLRHEIESLPNLRRDKRYDGDGYEVTKQLYKVENFAKDCYESFRMSDPECFEEALGRGIAVVVVRVSAGFIRLVYDTIDVAFEKHDRR